MADDTEYLIYRQNFSVLASTPNANAFYVIMSITGFLSALVISDLQRFVKDAFLVFNSLTHVPEFLSNLNS